jgi:hypothetical protein
MNPREDDYVPPSDIDDIGSKRAYATMAALQMYRVAGSKEPNQVSMLMLLTSLVLMNMSNGSDSMMAAAKRLISSSSARGIEGKKSK